MISINNEISNFFHGCENEFRLKLHFLRIMQAILRIELSHDLIFNQVGLRNACFLVASSFISQLQNAPQGEFFDNRLRICVEMLAAIRIESYRKTEFSFSDFSYGFINRIVIKFLNNEHDVSSQLGYAYTYRIAYMHGSLDHSMSEK